MTRATEIAIAKALGWRAVEVDPSAVFRDVDKHWFLYDASGTVRASWRASEAAAWARVPHWSTSAAACFSKDGLVALLIGQRFGVWLLNPNAGLAEGRWSARVFEQTMIRARVGEAYADTITLAVATAAALALGVAEGATA